MSDDLTRPASATGDEAEDQDVDPEELIPGALDAEDELELPDEDGVLPVGIEPDPLESGFSEDRPDPFLPETEEETW